MRRKIFLLLMSLGLLCMTTVAKESTNKLELLPLSVVVTDIPEEFPQTARVHIVNKINQILTRNSIASVNYMNQFLLAVVATPLTKDVVVGPPSMIAQNLEFTLYIVDNYDQKIMSTYQFATKGIGTNENKAYMDAIKRINPASMDLEEFITLGKGRIVAYYNAEIANIITKASSLAKMEQYEAALFELAAVPTVCERYADVQELATVIYQQYIDHECMENLARAKSLWMSEQNSVGAAKAAEYLSLIYPNASCYQDAELLYKEIKGKILDDWNFEMKKYYDSVDLEFAKVEAWRSVGVAYGENQRPITNTVTWLLK